MKSKILFSTLFIAFLGIANISMAQDGSFAKNHPRRAEVNHRMDHQYQRIHHKMKSGEMNRRVAHHLQHREHQIRKEERRMASRHGGHITRHEQQRLNHQENHLNRKIQRA